MEAWQQIIAQYPILQIICDCLEICVPLALLVAFSGLLYISATAKVMAIARGRSAFDKCARQIALLALILGWILVIGARAWLYYTQSQRVSGASLDFLYELSWMLLSLGALMTTIYYTLWRILKNMPVLHSTLGMISAVQNSIALVAVIFAIRLGTTVAGTDINNLAGLPDIFPTIWNSRIWSAGCYTVPLVFALAGAFSAFWLVLRRKKDDFGRDYYNAMLPWTAGWALFPWSMLWLLLLVSTTLQIWMGIQNATFSIDDSIWDCGRLLLWLLPIPIWIIIRKCAIPMRYKFINFLALLIAVSFIIPWFLELTEI